MPSNQLFRDTVKAIVLGDGAKARDFNAQVPASDRAAYTIYVAAMFATAVGHRFDGDHSHAAVRQFVEEMEYDFRDTEPPFWPLTMESMLRILFGEKQSLGNIVADDRVRLQLMAIRKIVGQSEHMRQQLDDYLFDAERLVNLWVNEQNWK